MERCELERMADMKLFLKDRKDELKEERLNKLRNVLRQEIGHLESILKGLVSDKKDGCLVIVYLRSSYITGSHNFHIIHYEGEPFVEEEPDSAVYHMQTFFQSADEDWNDMCNELAKHFIRIMDSEKEEIRRWYMEELYKGAIVLFKEMLGGMKAEKDKKVYYGSYMDELEWIGDI